MKENCLENFIKKEKNFDQNVSVDNIIFSTEDGTIMEDEKLMKYYDNSSPGEEVTMEINVNFKDVLALRICN